LDATFELLTVHERGETCSKSSMNVFGLMFLGFVDGKIDIRTFVEL